MLMVAATLRGNSDDTPPPGDRTPPRG